VGPRVATTVEVARNLDGDVPGACKAHRLAFRLTGGTRKPPQLDPDAKRREIM